MNKSCYRFFGGLTLSQERWLNKMSASGYRLVRTEKLLYGFEPCQPGQYQYCVEYIGHKSKESADDYARFLEDCGYRVFFKNINLNWNVGKVELRPWAEPGGRIATNGTTFNRELLIVERESTGRPFDLHTTYEDKRRYYKAMRRPWVFLLIVSLILAVAMRQPAWSILAAISLAGIAQFQMELYRLKKQAEIEEA